MLVGRRDDVFESYGLSVCVFTFHLKSCSLTIIFSSLSKVSHIVNSLWIFAMELVDSVHFIGCRFNGNVSPLWTAIDFVRCNFGSHRLIPTEANGHRPTDAGFQEMPYIPLKSPPPIDLCRMRTPSGDKHSNGSTVHLQRQWAKIICKWSGTITLWIWQVNRNVHEWMVKEKRRIVDDRELNEVKKNEIEWRKKKRTITKLFTFRANRPYVDCCSYAHKRRDTHGHN